MDRIVPPGYSGGTLRGPAVSHGATSRWRQLFGAVVWMCAVTALRDALRGLHVPASLLLGWLYARPVPDRDEIALLEQAAGSDLFDGYLAVRRLVAKLQMPDRCPFTNPMSDCPRVVDRRHAEHREAGRGHSDGTAA